MQNELIYPFRDYDILLVSLFTISPSVVSRHFSSRLGHASGQNDLPRRSLHENRFHLTSVPLNFRYAYVNQLTYGTREKWSPWQLVFWEPANAPGTTAMMSNSGDGNRNQVHAFSRDVAWTSIFVQFNNRDEKSQFANFFHYFTAAAGRNGRKLSVGTEENGRWGFWHGGPVQPFENPEYYKRRRIRDRLSRNVIVEYLQKLGWDITDQAFWTSKQPAILMWDDWLGRRSAPGRDGIDPEGTRTGWTPEPEKPTQKKT